ncbi:MAG: exo-rhamnogalacturonan lyase family protein [Planctomycetota bacterium]|jgi:hypothetical protein
MSTAIRKITAVMFLFSLCTCSLQAAAPAFRYIPEVENKKYDSNLEKINYKLTKVSEKITIDADFNEPCWKNYKNPVIFGRGHDMTYMRAAFDDKNLYLAAECRYEKGSPLRMQDRPRDYNTWSDECLEIWTWPSSKRKKKGFYQFIINPLGCIYDAESKKASYNPDWQVKTRRAPGKWFVELAIPLEVLQSSSADSYLKFNIGRNTPSGNFSWTGTYGDIERGRLLFNDFSEQKQTAEVDPNEPFVINFKNTAIAPEMRFCEAAVKVPQHQKLDDVKIEAKLFRTDTEKVIAKQNLQPSAYEGKLLIDVRKYQINQILLILNIYSREKLVLNENTILKLESPKVALNKETKIPILLDIPEGADKFKDFPVTFGVPFGKGALWDIKNLAVVDSKDNVIPAEFEISGRWVEEGAAKWVRVDTVFSAGENYFVTLKENKPAAAGGIRITSKTDTEITVENSRAVFVLGKGPSPIKEIKLGGKTVASSAGTKGLYVIDSKGRIASAASKNETMKIESEGPVEVCVRFEGDYVTSEGEKTARHITRVRCYYDKPFADITHTLVISTDTEKLWLKDVGWEMALTEGKGKTAWFGASAADQKVSQEVTLTDEAYMIQESHYRFKNDKNKFSIAAVSNGKESVAKEGQECGDWTAFSNGSSGLGVICKDSARQNPKEFMVKGNKITMKLFSSRKGEELDFRSTACIKRWGLQNLYDKTLSRGSRRNQIERVSAIKSNAFGWSKSHEISWVPFTANNFKDTAERAVLRNDPVYALISPEWIYRTKAMGALYPKTAGKFEEVESSVEGIADFWMSKVPDFGFLGFIDYFATHGFWKGDYPLLRRYSLNYGTRSFYWYLYARSGERKYREYAENVNRTWMDGNFSHLTGHSKVKGLYTRSVGADDKYRDSQYCLPFYWGSENQFHKSSTTDLNKLINYYYLTGYRRAKDCMYQYADGLKNAWAKKIGEREWRHFGMLIAMQQAYQFTFDNEVKYMADFMADFLYDEKTALLVTKNKGYNSLYKTNADIVKMINTPEILGRPELKEMAKRVSRFWWNNQSDIFGYANPRAFIGSYLYSEEKDPRIPAVLDRMLGELAVINVKKLKESGSEIAGVRLKFALMGFAWAQHVVSSAPQKSFLKAGEIRVSDVNEKTALVVKKENNKKLTAVYKGAADFADMTANVSVKTDGVTRGYGDTNGLKLVKICSLGSGATDITVPVDAPAGNYLFCPSKTGSHIYRYGESEKAVLYGPDFWKMTTLEKPGRKVFFEITDKCERPEIFFQEATKLYTPDNKLYKDKAVSGWTKLPKDSKGIWRFDVEGNGWTKVRDIAPFFAFDSKENLMIPGINWKKDQKDGTEQKSDGSKSDGFVKGAINLKDNQALRIIKKSLYISENKTDADKSVMPFKTGTIEFFIKPDWNTFDLPKNKSKSLFRVKTNAPKGIRNTWSLSYMYRPDHSLWFFNESFYAEVLCAKKGNKDARTQVWRRTLVEDNRWIHLAWTWRIIKNSGKKGVDMLATTVYVNGKKGKSQVTTQDLAEVMHKPVSFYITGREFKGEIDELRVSNNVRYREDFYPPARNAELTADKNTLMLFHFNGNLEGESGVTDEKIVATLK